MSSLEIAELTGKRHDNVMADVRKMLDDLELGSLNFQSSYRSEQGKELPCFNLPKRECLILVSGYDIKLRARIIDRWQELEARAANPVPAAPDFTQLSTKEFLLLLTQQTMKLDAAETRLAIVEPKAAAQVCSG